MVLALSSPVAPAAVIVTTSGATGGMGVGIVTISVFSDVTSGVCASVLMVLLSHTILGAQTLIGLDMSTLCNY